MKKYKNVLVWLLASFGIVSCGSILAPQSQRQIVTYEIVDTSLTGGGMPSCQSASSAVLFVSPTRASAPYDNYKMYYSTESYQLSQYGYSQWIVPASELLNQNIAKKLVASCSFKNVVTSNAVADANYRLVTYLVMLRHEVDKTNNTANAHLVVLSELIDLNKNKILSTYLFDQKTPTDVSPNGYVVGVSKLTTSYDAQLADWLQKQINSR